MDESRVNVIRPDGEIVTLPQHQVDRAVQSGYRVASAQDLRRSDLFDEYGSGLDNQLKAFAQGATEEVPFLGGAVLNKLTTKEARDAREEFFPGTVASGKVSSILAQAAATGGTLGAITKAGKFAGAGSKVLGAATEGALFNLGSAVNESVLGDTELTKDKVMSAVGSGALLGGTAGALFGGIEKFSKSTQGKAVMAAMMEQFPDEMATKGAKWIAEKVINKIPGVGPLKTVKDQLLERATSYLDEVGVLGAIDTAARKTTSKVLSGAKEIFKENPAPYLFTLADDSTKEETQEARTKSFEELKKRVDGLAMNPELFQSTLQDKTDAVFPHAPAITAGIQSSMVNIVEFLKSKMPQSPEEAPLSPKWAASQTEIKNFFRYYDAIKNPTSILKDIVTGNLTQQSLEAVSTIYPHLYGEMQTEVLDKLTTHKGKLPYRTKMMLSMFLDVPLMQTAKPQSILANQISMNSPSVQSGENKVGPSQKGLGSLNIAQRSLTPMQRSSERAK